MAPLVLCLMGPTASGKTDLAIEIAGALPCELVSVDSALVYRGLDIGSAKPDYPHRLIDIRDPSEPYSVAEFCEDARAAIDDIIGAGRTPLLVGGTMLYFKSLLEGISDMPASDPAVRRELEQQAVVEGWPALHRRLAEVDAALAETIHPNHSQRICRALEIYMTTGITMSDWRSRRSEGLLAGRFQVVQLAIAPADRAVLHRRIERRVDQMLEAGLVDEVRALHERGDLDLDLPAMRAVGYRQMWGYVEGEYGLDRARELVIQATRQLAKRQLTWLRGWPDLHWIYTDADGRAAPDPDSVAASEATALDEALKYLPAATIDSL